MGFKDILEKMGEKSREKRERVNSMADQLRLQKIAMDRQKSSNERELERFMEEDREERIKEQLDIARKNRENDIRFNHNPLDTPNITSGTQWEVLKENNMFKNSKSNLFSNHGSVLKNNRNLLKNNKRLFR